MQSLKVITASVNNKRAMAARAQLAPDADADLLLLDAETLELRYVVARGEVLRRARTRPSMGPCTARAPGSGVRTHASLHTPRQPAGLYMQRSAPCFVSLTSARGAAAAARCAAVQKPLTARPAAPPRS